MSLLLLAVTVAPTINDSVIGRLYRHFAGHAASTEKRVLILIGLTAGTHVVVTAIRRISEWIILKSHATKSPFGIVVRQPRVITVHRLIVSGIIFGVYFFALGLMLQELGVNLTAYLAGASVIGLAISFGSQSLVQDIVIGLTLIFSDAMNVGEMVEIAGTVTVIGTVERIGLRFTNLTNLYNQQVLIPNRTIANVSRFPHGGVDAYADVWVPSGADPAKVGHSVQVIAQGMWAQFGTIILGEPAASAVQSPAGGDWSYIRVHFKIWPGQGSLIETTFRQQVVRSLKAYDPGYADWQVPVTYRAGMNGGAH